MTCKVISILAVLVLLAVLSPAQRAQQCSPACQKEIDDLTTNVQILTTDVQTLKTNVQILTTDVQTLATDVQTLKTDVQTLKNEVNTLTTATPTLDVDKLVASPQKSGAQGHPAEKDLSAQWGRILLIEVAASGRVMSIPFLGDMQPTSPFQPDQSFKLPVDCPANPGLVKSGTLSVSVTKRVLQAIALGCPTDINFEVTLLLKK